MFEVFADYAKELRDESGERYESESLPDRLLQCPRAANVELQVLVYLHGGHLLRSSSVWLFVCRSPSRSTTAASLRQLSTYYDPRWCEKRPLIELKNHPNDKTRFLACYVRKHDSSIHDLDGCLLVSSFYTVLKES